MLLRSATGVSSGRTRSACFVTGPDSPVSSASSTVRLWASTRRRSAGTREPAATRTRSPGTRSSAGRVRGWPSRTTSAVGATRAPRASSARSARASCTAPRRTFRTTMARMASASSLSPARAETTAATVRRTTKNSLAWCRSRCPHEGGLRRGRRFGPRARSRFAPSGSASPRSGCVSRSSSTSRLVMACQACGVSSSTACPLTGPPSSSLRAGYHLAGPASRASRRERRAASP